MHRFHALVRRFRGDEGGAFAIMFGIMAIVIIAMGGAVVDYVSLEQTRNRAQIALDAAALALQPQIFGTTMNKEQIRVAAERLMVERIGGEWGVTASIPTDGIVINVDEGSLYLRARMRMPTTFVALVGVQEMYAQIQSEATRKKLALEVVMVLDNSASMKDENRMTYLQDAAKCAAYTLFYTAVQNAPKNANTCVNTPTATRVENVKIGVVPFTMFVNVGTANRTATWIDQYGSSSISNDNFDNDDNEDTTYTGTVNRFSLFNAVKENWRGCVEARPHTKTGSAPSEYLDTDDSPATGADSLFVPMFSPDLPDAIYSGVSAQSYLSDQPNACYYSGTCSRVVRDSSCNSNYSSCSSTTNGSWSLSGPKGKTGSLSCTCSSSITNGTYSYGTSNGNRWRERTQSCTFNYPAQGLSRREMQERLCKYTGTVSNSAFSTGPNADCTRQAILPLTDNPTTVVNTIGGMIAEGGTNIHEGTAWGYRTLSPGLPFDEGVDYDEATSKVLIIMTDGENTAYNVNGNNQQDAIVDLNGSIWYSAYGWPYNSRLGTKGTANSALVDEMNRRTLQTCANAKRSLSGSPQGKIRIFTIGLATNKVTQSTQAVVEQMLKDCASEPSMAYFPKSPTELKSVFANIANELANLRLAQ